jgi:branched-chain amino acid transport system ATP-binding protein
MYFELKNISVHYDKVQALENVTMQLEQGEIVALIGANGAGKTNDTATTGGGRRAWYLDGAGRAACLSVHVR